jgi:hypothetical protein
MNHDKGGAAPCFPAVQIGASARYYEFTPFQIDSSSIYLPLPASSKTYLPEKANLIPYRQNI